MFIHSTDINVMAGSLGWLPVDDTLDRQSSSLLAPWTWRPTIHTPANTTTLFHPTPPFVQFETPKTPTLTGTARARAPASLGKESTHIPRPSNAFILFRAHLSRSSKEKGWDHIALSQNAGQAWHQLPPDEKQVFYDQAAKLKQQHALMNPTYRYNPVRKGKRTRRKSESYATPLFPTWNSISEPAKPIRRPRAASAPGKIISLRPSITIATGVEMTSEPSFQAKMPCAELSSFYQEPFAPAIDSLCMLKAETGMMNGDTSDTQMTTSSIASTPEYACSDKWMSTPHVSLKCELATPSPLHDPTSPAHFVTPQSFEFEPWDFNFTHYSLEPLIQQTFDPFEITFV